MGAHVASCKGKVRISTKAPLTIRLPAIQRFLKIQQKINKHVELSFAS